MNVWTRGDDDPRHALLFCFLLLITIRSTPSLHIAPPVALLLAHPPLSSHARRALAPPFLAVHKHPASAATDVPHPLDSGPHEPERKRGRKHSDEEPEEHG